MNKSSVINSLAIMLALSCNAWAIECPDLKAAEDPKLAATIAEILPEDADLDAPDAVKSAVFDLKQAGVADDLIVDNLVSVYCRSVASLGDVSEDDKSQRVQAFSESASEVVFGPAD